MNTIEQQFEIFAIWTFSIYFTLGLIGSIFDIIADYRNNKPITINNIVFHIFCIFTGWFTFIVGSICLYGTFDTDKVLIQRRNKNERI